MKNSIWIIVAVLAIIGIATGAILFQQLKNNTPEEITDSTRFHRNYPGVPENNKFVYATSEEVIDIFEKGTGLVFLGFPECPWCQKLAPITNEAASQTNIDKIYYLNIKEAREKNDSTYQKLINHLENVLPKDEEGNPKIYVPDLTAVASGEIVGRFTQEEAEGSPSPAEYWTEERKKSAIEQIKDMINKMDQSEFSKIKNEVENGNATLLDVRTTEEFAAGHFSNATNLDVEKIAAGIMPEIPKDSKVYLYCRSGNRSAQATSLLNQAGFTNVTDLGGLSQVKNIGGQLINN